MLKESETLKKERERKEKKNIEFGGYFCMNLFIFKQQQSLSKNSLLFCSIVISIRVRFRICVVCCCDEKSQKKMLLNSKVILLLKLDAIFN